MGTVTEKTILNSKIENTWRFITNPENFSKYVHGYAYGKIISPNKVGVGAKYEWYGKLGPFKLKSTEEIVEWEEPKHVAYSGTMVGIQFDSSMDVQEGEDGRTMLTITIKYKVPILLGGKVADILLVKSIVGFNVEKSIKKLKEILS